MRTEKGIGPLAPELCAELRKLVERSGEKEAASVAGVSTMSVYRALAGLDLQAGTRTIIAMRIAEPAPLRAA